ncbi:hypothetical protein AC579_3427 [Pseudocercospora musae]|uniref:C3H1-type domain-containing protein n=1 Tax=Pseudocercospora musae TaxID=113226 RepID=A0A139I662_9PEZI|nr:hypothetical protein AC579_3427 [Pseudocercospora musae]
MLSHGLATARTAALRPLRPPSIPQPRPFTQRSRVLLIAAARAPRPQLPYLTQPLYRYGRPQAPMARLLSTENRRFVREQVWLAAKWTARGWLAFGLLGVAWFGYNIEVDERSQPTPNEWRFGTRQLLRAARAFSDPETSGQTGGGGIVNWPKVGGHYINVLARLEDVEREGEGLVEVEVGEGEGEAMLIPGVGRGGFDISGKTWPWKAGYFEAIMGCAQAAEHLEGMVLDQTRGLVFPKEFMIGPSNPDARPTPPYMKAAPREEHCTAPFPPPETFYMRVLSARGFTTAQQLDAALSYAHWLELKGRNEAAAAMYTRGVHVATAALPDAVQAADVLDANTCTLRDAAPHVTPNLLRASTALAIHRARTGNIAESLPILVSVLRARRTAPISPSPGPEPEPPHRPAFGLWNFLFVPPQFPDPPPSGDTPLIRTSSEPSCSDAELMLYIGEIIFASSSKSDGGWQRHAAEEGVAWTKKAVAIADAQLAKPARASASDPERENEREKCRECLVTGVGNWELMLQRLAHQEQPVAKCSTTWKFWQKSKSRAGEADNESSRQEDQETLARLRERIIRDALQQHPPVRPVHSVQRDDPITLHEIQQFANLVNPPTRCGAHNTHATSQRPSPTAHVAFPSSSMSHTAQQEILAIRPTEQTCFSWARGETCPLGSTNCRRPHHFYPTVVWRTLPSSSPHMPRDHPKQLKSTRCPLWPSYLCPWSAPELCPYAHETTRDAEKSTRMQDAARMLCEQGKFETVLRFKCRACQKSFHAMQDAAKHHKGCWKRRVKNVVWKTTDGSVEGLEVFERMKREDKPTLKPLRDLIYDAWKDIVEADEQGMWPNNEELRRAAREHSLFKKGKAKLIE